MSKRVRLILIGVGGLLLMVASAAWLAYSASHYVPAFYRDAMEVALAKQETDSDAMLRQATALISALKKEGAWEFLFTADQINGWLAFDMVKNHPSAMAPTFLNPRVAIGPKGITVAGLFETEKIWSVVNLTIEPSVPEPNVLSLRIVNARAGMLPAPLKKITDQLTQAASHLHWKLEWRQADGDPVARITLPENSDGTKWRTRVESLRLGEGEIFIAGATSKGG
jgi:hypothetical protein